LNYRFQPHLLPALATLLCVALFIRLGLWQLHKAEAKQALQAQSDRHVAEAPTALPESMDNPQEWRYRNVRVSGSYDPRYQILLDNQVANAQAGYHVVTPFKIEHTERYILVNRGWIPALAQHSEIPPVETPSGTMEVVGNLWLPSDKIYALEEAPQATADWQTVWQNMDMKRYQQAVPFKLYPLIVRLAPESSAGGFVREWPRPAERIETHLGYAYQWFGFAATAIAIYLFLSFRKVEQ
jgi:surfeit locus 1 family protein